MKTTLFWGTIVALSLAMQAAILVAVGRSSDGPYSGGSDEETRVALRELRLQMGRIESSLGDMQNEITLERTHPRREEQATYDALPPSEVFEDPAAVIAFGGQVRLPSLSDFERDYRSKRAWLHRNRHRTSVAQLQDWLRSLENAGQRLAVLQVLCMRVAEDSSAFGSGELHQVQLWMDSTGDDDVRSKIVGAMKGVVRPDLRDWLEDTIHEDLSREVQSSCLEVLEVAAQGDDFRAVELIRSFAVGDDSLLRKIAGLMVMENGWSND